MRKELNCSIFRAMDVLGDRWTLMVLREAFMGVRRFTDMQRDLGVARNVLTDRLNLLVDAGVLERRQYQERPVRHEYRLTDMGKELQPAILTLMHWGDTPPGPARPAGAARARRLRPRHRAAAGLLALPRAADDAQRHAEARPRRHRRRTATRA